MGTRTFSCCLILVIPTRERSLSDQHGRPGGGYDVSVSERRLWSSGRIEVWFASQINPSNALRHEEPIYHHTAFPFGVFSCILMTVSPGSCVDVLLFTNTEWVCLTGVKTTWRMEAHPLNRRDHNSTTRLPFNSLTVLFLTDQLKQLLEHIFLLF